MPSRKRVRMNEGEPVMDLDGIDLEDEDDDEDLEVWL